MAKITIELDTGNPDDSALLVSLGSTIDSLGLNTGAGVPLHARPPIHMAADDEAPTETTEATNDRPTSASGTRRTRKSKADAAPASGAEQPSPGPQSSDVVTTGADTSADQPEISVAAVNLKLRQLLDAKVPALKLQEIVKEATDGKYMSANQASNANDVAGLKAIMAGLEFFEASLK